MNEHDDQPFDDRHNTPPVPVYAFSDENRDALRPGRMQLIDQPLVFSSTGLVWRFAPGQELQDIGRTFTTPEALDNVHSVDLRTILAHLDSAATAIKAELDERYSGRRG